MFQPKCLVVGALLGAASLHAESKWIHMQNDDFKIYSEANERDTRSTLNYFERVRTFFLQMSGRTVSNPLPVYIIMFDSAKSYEPYKTKEFALAYYAPGADRD